MNTEESNGMQKLGHWGITVEIPDDFVWQSFATKTAYKKTLDNGDDVYFLYISNIYYELFPIEGLETYDEHDVATILDYHIWDTVNAKLPCRSMDFKLTMDTEESAEVAGLNTFVRNTGIMHIEDAVNGIKDMPFVAYFGTYPPADGEEVNKVPGTIMVFSDTSNPETIEYMTTIVDNVAKSAVLGNHADD